MVGRRHLRVDLAGVVAVEAPLFRHPPDRDLIPPRRDPTPLHPGALDRRGRPIPAAVVDRTRPRIAAIRARNGEASLAEVAKETERGRALRRGLAVEA